MAVYRLKEGYKKFSDRDFNEFLNKYYYGLPRTKLSDIKDINLINSAIQYCLRELKRTTLNSESREFYYKILNILRSNRDIAKKKLKGTYDLEKQISSDIMDCIEGTEVDFDKLSKVSRKYKDHYGLYSRIKNRILDKEMWYD